MSDWAGFGGSEERQRGGTDPTATAASVTEGPPVESTSAVRIRISGASNCQSGFESAGRVSAGQVSLSLVGSGSGLGVPRGVRLDCDLQPFGSSRPRVLLQTRPEPRIVDVQVALLHMKVMVHLVEPV